KLAARAAARMKRCLDIPSFFRTPRISVRRAAYRTVVHGSWQPRGARRDGRPRRREWLPVSEPLARSSPYFRPAIRRCGSAGTAVRPNPTTRCAMGEKKTETVEPGSGDVLVDLGFADASERKLRVELAM